MNTIDTFDKVSPARRKRAGKRILGKSSMSCSNEAIYSFAFDSKDEFGPFLNERVILNVNWLDRPLFGVIKSVGQSFISLSRKDGRIIKIRRSSILAVEQDRKEAV